MPWIPTKTGYEFIIEADDLTHVLATIESDGRTRSIVALGDELPGVEVSDATARTIAEDIIERRCRLALAEVERMRAARRAAA